MCWLLLCLDPSRQRSGSGVQPDTTIDELDWMIQFAARFNARFPFSNADSRSCVVVEPLQFIVLLLSRTF